MNDFKDIKNRLILDIEKLLNSYDDVHSTHIDKNLLQFMDENTLKDIISSLLEQKEKLDVDEKWLEKFKNYKI